MKKILSTLALFVACAATAAAASAEARKIAIIKADDVRSPTTKWDRFVTVSQARGVKVSLGIICDSLADASPAYLAWLRAHAASGQVEFWNHGWDHKRWTDDQGNELREFKGSGRAHQNKHYHDAKAAFTAALGSPPAAFGAPYNAVDEDTLAILNADADLKLYFGYNARGITRAVVAPMALRGEHDGTGKPNFEKFLAEYKTKPALNFVALQFHPQNFAEEHFVAYTRILDFLLSEGWSFLLPGEYVALPGVK